MFLLTMLWVLLAVCFLLALLVFCNPFKWQSVGSQICDEVLLDCFAFVEREQHLSLKLANRRFFHLSSSVHTAKRYPPATWKSFSIEAKRDFHGLVVGSSISAYTRAEGTRDLEFPDQAPPEHILPFRGHIHIGDCIDQEVLRFLRLCSGRLFTRCSLSFSDFANFTKHYSEEFFVNFLALFPAFHSMSFAKLARNHESFIAALSDRTDCLFLSRCAADFPLECLLGWLHANGPQTGNGRWLHINGMNNQRAIRDFAEGARKRFLAASQPRPFFVSFNCEGSFCTPNELLLSDLNAQTGETLTLKQCCDKYTLERRVPGQFLAVGTQQQCSCPNAHPSIHISAMSRGHFGTQT